MGNTQELYSMDDMDENVENFLVGNQYSKVEIEGVQDTDDNTDEEFEHELFRSYPPGFRKKVQLKLNSLVRSRERELVLSSGDVHTELILDMDEVKEAQNAWDKREFEPDAHEIEILGAFLSGVGSIEAMTSSTVQMSIISKCLVEFREIADLEHNDIHTVTAELPHGMEIVRAYLEACELDVAPVDDALQEDAKSALLLMQADGAVGLYAVFGGQGVPWLAELRSAYQNYPSVRHLVDSISETLKRQAESSEAKGLGLYDEGFDIRAWIDRNSVPSEAYLRSAPISYPAVGITQLVNYATLLYSLGQSPKQFRKHLQGTSGHSQGVVASAVIASADTFDDFNSKTVACATYLFWHGARVQQVYPQRVLSQKILKNSEESGSGQPTPMLSVIGLPVKELKKYVDQANKLLSPRKRLSVSLINGAESAVVSGDCKSLHNLRSLLSSVCADPDESQDRIPFSKRKPVFSMRYLPVSVPFHSHHCGSAVALIMTDIDRLQLNFCGQLYIPVHSTIDGSNLQGSDDLIQKLVEMQVVHPVDWIKTCSTITEKKESIEQKEAISSRITHVLDFGPGHSYGAGRLVYRNVEGYGVKIIGAGSFKGDHMVSSKAMLFETDPSKIEIVLPWGEEFRPRVVKNGDEHVLKTKFTKVYGQPPVFVPGMTPTTAPPQFVVSVLKSGFHAELAGGGQHLPHMLTGSIEHIIDNTPDGTGVTINLLFLNPYLWNFQFPQLLEMKKKGYPIDSITIAAGVPTPDKADQILKQMYEVGITKVAFKPGTTGAVKSVVDIAERNPYMNVALQWTGGQSGGHHSCENQHKPILDTYGLIRQHSNIVLVVGGGIGCAEDAVPYMTGEWSVKFGKPPMPFDALLTGTRVMVAKEAFTEPSVKQLILAADGVPNDGYSWEKTFAGSAGGVITIKSELEEPIHKLATRGMKLWKEIDDKFLSLPRDQVGKAVAKNKKYLVDRINADFQKPFFGQKLDGTVVYDVSEMTYFEVAKRIADIMCPPINNKWCDITYYDRWRDWMIRCLDRFAYDRDCTDILDSIKESSPSLSGTNPRDTLDMLMKMAPETHEQLMSPQDEDYFLFVCLRPRQPVKPINFIPYMDQFLKFYFKKDSLWFSEDLSSVPDQDPDRVCILQGPVATRSSKVVDEPVGSILGGIMDGIIKVASPGHRDRAFDSKAAKLRNLFSKYGAMQQDQRTLSIHQESTELPDKQDWLELIAGAESWGKALLLSPSIVRGKRWIPNLIKDAFSPRAGQTVVISSGNVDDKVPRISILDPSLCEKLGLNADTPLVEARLKDSVISLSFTHIAASGGEANLKMSLTYHAPEGYKHAFVSEENWSERCSKISAFYADLWLSSSDLPPLVGHEESESDQEPDDLPHLEILDKDEEKDLGPGISAKSIRQFRTAINDPVLDVYSESPDKERAPLDYGIVICWEAIMNALIEAAPDTDLLSLLHLSNEFIVPPNASPLFSGDEVRCTGELVSVWDENGLRVITVLGRIYESQHDVLKMEIVSKFAVKAQGFLPDLKGTVLFKKEDSSWRVNLESTEGVAVLNSKSWVYLRSDPQLNDVLDVDVTVNRRPVGDRFSCSTSGTIHRNGEEIGEIKIEQENVSECIVLGYLSRYGKKQRIPTDFEERRFYQPYTQVACKSNLPYAVASKDVNPIHSNPYITQLSGLSSPIVHGMHSSAVGRQVIERLVDGVIRRYRAEFAGIIMNDMTLNYEVSLTGMVNGYKVVNLVAKDAETGSVRLKAEAEVEQAKCAYLFTGQGSALENMGMDLYESSEVAKSVWDRAEQHFRQKYGFSILAIVRDNPKEIFVPFDGPQEIVDELRRNYAELTVWKEGKHAMLFPEATDPSSRGILFQSSDDGLLFSTQFQQPAILLAEKAAYEDLKSRQIITSKSQFAGHSLGEYGALACVVSNISVQKFAEIVFLRGLTMQSVVERDQYGRSRYGMVAASPRRVNPEFSDKALFEIVNQLEARTGQLLQTVNYNIRGQQYVIAGGLGALEALRICLSSLSKETHPVEQDAMEFLLADACKGALEKQAATEDGYLPLKRGRATIPLQGIDVPFHSKLLMDGVPSFRKVLESVWAAHTRPDDLIGSYIPNLLGVPFNMSREFITAIQTKTQSPVLAEVLENWAEQSSEANRTRLCSVIVIELLAYQFASPVLWISTQDALVKNGIERFIEIGPQPVLLPFLMKSYTQYSGFELLWIGKDKENIHCQADGMSEPDYLALTSVGDEEDDEDDDEEEAPVVQQVQVYSAPVAAPTEKVSIPMNVLHSLRVLVSQKLKLSLDSVNTSKTVKALAGGKSAVQNEILGDMASEFRAEPENAGTTPLKELAEKITERASYPKPGKVLSTSISTLASLVLPGGFGLSKLRKYLGKAWNIDESAVEGILVHATQYGVRPKKRFESDKTAKSWADKLAESFSKSVGVPISKPVAAAPGPQVAGPTVINAEDIEDIGNFKSLLFKQMKLLQGFFDDSEEKATATATAADASSDVGADWAQLLEAEHGTKYVEGIRPRFNAKKVRHYNAWWNWARQDALKIVDGLGNLDATQKYLIANRASPSLLSLLRCMEDSPAAQSLCEEVKQQLDGPASYIEHDVPMLPETTISTTGKVEVKSSPRYENGYTGFCNDVLSTDNTNRVELRMALGNGVGEDGKKVAEVFSGAVRSVVTSGISFAGKTALVTGAGSGSIGLEVTRCLLMGGCKVIVTTSRPSRERWQMYRKLYKQYGGKDSELIVVPFNAASSQDVESLVSYIMDADGLNMRLPSFILPFAAIPENGRDIGRIDAISELAHRAMLTNVIRLLGAFKNRLQPAGSVATTHVILPMSPNHGLFGGDGLYSESKLALETLFRKWRSEGWGSNIGLVGAEIGWTRGTGLMDANDVIASGIEKECNLRTFGTDEMSLLLISLLSQQVVNLAKAAPLKADLSGGFANLAASSEDIPAVKIRKAIELRSLVAKTVHGDTGKDRELETAEDPVAKIFKVQKRANPGLQFPKLPSVAELKEANNPALRDLIDLSKAVVVVGFGEVGPWGSARTRWEWECFGKFSHEGAIELARAMGYVKYNSRGGGWIDVKTKKPVKDLDIVKIYGSKIREHCGVRPVDSSLFRGYDPKKKMFLQQIALEADMPPFDVTDEREAEYLRKHHGDRIVLEPTEGGWAATLRKGAVIYVPKDKNFDVTVAGQIPTGWDSTKYGIPKEITNSIDPVTQYALAATMDAFATAGISDPYELYHHVHVSEVGNSVGSGMGGMKSLREIFRERMLEEPTISSDVLQETFINTTAAWINMLILSASGPIKTPVAACASALVSTELGVETIKSGKAKVMVVGGTEDFGEEGSFEFSQMKATSNSTNEYAQGREADEHCRPATSTRGGFMESQGSGIQILMSADIALEMGLPIYAVVGGAWTASDKAGRSVPAPGQGILSTTKELKSSYKTPLLSLDYRHSQFQTEAKHIESWYQSQVNIPPSTEDDEQIQAHKHFLRSEKDRRHRGIQRTWGLDFYQENPSIAPLRGALAAWGFTPDHIDACSFHGTGTAANDQNESDVVNQQMRHLGRSEGLPLPTIFQKWMTGHPKGAAAAWMMNGVIQSLLSGNIPGNRNADNIDPNFQQFEYLVYLDETIQKPHPLRAAYLHSFGFGQAGAEVLVLHPNTLFSALSDESFTQYASKCYARELKANRHFLDALCDKKPLIAIKSLAPYETALETDDQTSLAQQAYLNPLSRTNYSEKTDEWKIAPGPVRPAVEDQSIYPKFDEEKKQTFSEQEQINLAVQSSLQPSENSAMGVDVEETSPFESKDDTFIDRNYTNEEKIYCQNAPDKAASLAGRWCAKEAVIKAISSISPESGGLWKGAGAPLSDIEILSSVSGAPVVVLHGHAKNVAETVGIDNVKVSISHTERHAVAVAQAIKKTV